MVFQMGVAEPSREHGCLTLPKKVRNRRSLKLKSTSQHMGMGRPGLSDQFGGFRGVVAALFWLGQYQADRLIATRISLVDSA